MQTFVPLTNVHECARRLDRARLGKQRVEASQLLAHLLGERMFRGGYMHHPIIKMWRGYENGLARYGVVMCLEWINRGYQDSLLDYFHTRTPFRMRDELPPWWGDERIHASHRSNLLRKVPDHYRRFWSDERDDLPYVWSEVHDGGSYTLWYSRTDARRLGRPGPA